MKNIIGILGALILISAVVYIIVQIQKNPTVVKMTPTPPTTPIISKVVEKPTAIKQSTNEPTSVANQYKYTSYKLGISFLYLKEQNGMKFKVDEDVDNEKIYLYQDVTYIQDPRKSAQYVEVTRKDTSENLQKALENSVLADYSPSDCKVTTDIKVEKHTNYEYANVVVAKPYNGLDELMPLLEKCPSPYTASNGLSYFVSPINGNRYAFLSIGQYGIMSGVDNKGWQDTLEFID